MENYHVTKENDQWHLIKQGSTRASLVAATKADLLQKTHTFMIGKKASVKIHGIDGTIQEERTFPREDDPVTSKG